MHQFFRVKPVDRKEIVVVDDRPIVFEIKQSYKITILFGNPELDWHLRLVPGVEGFTVVSEDLKVWKVVSPWRANLLKTSDDTLRHVLFCVCEWMFENSDNVEDRLKFAKVNPILLRHLSQWMYRDSLGVWPDNGDYPEAEQYAYIVPK